MGASRWGGFAGGGRGERRAQATRRPLPRWRRVRQAASLAAGALVVAGLLAACAQPSDPPEPVEPFSFVIDESITPRQPTLLGPAGERPVVALRDVTGIQYDYLATEVIVLPRSAAELADFLDRRGGVVVSDHQEDDAERTVVVQLDASAFPLDDLESNARRERIPGEHRFSSELAVRLVALVLHERASGMRIATDGLHAPDQAILLGTAERNGTDMFADDAFDHPAERSGVVAAWQYLAGQTLGGPLRRVRVAIIDGGFLVTGGGTTVPDANGASDFPVAPLQFDYVHNTSIISGANAARCTGGNDCPWHGHGSASVATGALNNGAYAAGTGGQVADAILLNVDLSTSQVKAALDRARGWGAEVVNMSFGGECNAFCAIEKDFSGYYLAFNRALNAGIVLVAAAGNDGKDSFEVNRLPCALPHTICIGALGWLSADGKTFDRDNRAISYSNHGRVVELYAPTNIPAWYGSDRLQPPDIATFGGTSASAPYVSGVVAMMRSVNPSLDVQEVFDILMDTAWTDSPDPKVGAYLNAYEAVRRAAEHRMPADAYEPNESGAAARTLTAGAQTGLTIDRTNDADFFRLAAAGARFVDLGLNYPGRIGRPSLPPFGTETSQSCGGLEQIALVRGANTLGATYRVATGSFVWAVTSPGNPLPYDMHVNVRSAPVSADGFEPNNTLGTATNVPSGYVSGTLHSSFDVDVYGVYSEGAFSTMVLSMSSLARVESSDAPLTLELFNSGQQFLGSSTASAGCASQASIAIPQGFHFVRVSGAAAGEYRLWLGSQATQHPVLDISVIIYLILHPNVPVEFVLREPEAWFVLSHVSDYPSTGLRLEGAGLRLALYSEDGQQLLGESVTSADLQTHTLTMPAAPPVGQYLVQVSRTEPALAGGVLPLIPATITSLE